ncbi:Spo0B domain-containing protein [Lentibacillus halophilus]
MEEQDVIQLLRRYRHDVLNQLQVVDGYLSMEKLEKARAKLKDYTQQLQEESKLVNLNAPFFALYVFQWDTFHPNFRLTYSIHTKNRDLQYMDSLLVKWCNAIMHSAESKADVSKLYDIHVLIDDNDEDMLQLRWLITGTFADLPALKDMLNNIGQTVKAIEHDNGLLCTADIPCK